MREYIDRESAREKLCSMCRYEGTTNCDGCEHPIDDIPAADVVARPCFDQILWENDVMHEQLSSIGKQLGVKMDDVCVVKKGYWTDHDSSIKGVATEACSVCGEWSYGYNEPFCQKCGAVMEDAK